LGLEGRALAIAVAGASVHFALARCTRYPQGAIGLVSFRTHAYIELAEGAAVLVAALIFAEAPLAKMFLAVMGALQFGAFRAVELRLRARSLRSSI